MVGRWLLLLALLVNFCQVSLQPLAEEGKGRHLRQLGLEDCCPCPDSPKATEQLADGSVTSQTICPCDRAADSEASPSILLPALRAIQPFMKHMDEKSDPKPLLQPEVGFASSVLETLREATEEEYQDALARDAARSTVQLIESNLSSLDDVSTETPKNIVRIFLNPQGDDMDDNVPESSHIQETRCIHPPLDSVHNIGRLRMNPQRQNYEISNLPRKPLKKLSDKNILHRKFYDMDSDIGASTIHERVVQPNVDSESGSISLKALPTQIDSFTHNVIRKNDGTYQKSTEKDLDGDTLDQKLKPKMQFKLRDLLDNLEANSLFKDNSNLLGLKKYFSTTTRAPPIKFKSMENPDTRPTLLNNLLKLKDVELIPPELTKKVAINKSKSLKELPQKLRDTRHEINDLNRNIDCKDDHSGLASSIYEDTRDIAKTNNPDINDAATSSSILNPALGIPTSDDSSFKENILLSSVECSSSSENRNMNKISLKADNIEDSNFDDYNDNTRGDDNSDDSLLENNYLSIQQLPDMEYQRQENKNGIGTDQRQISATHNSLTDDNTFNESLTNDACHIELVEDLQLPLAYENSSLVSSLKNTDTDYDNIQKDNISEEDQGILNDPIAETSNQELQFTNEENLMPQFISKNIQNDCYSNANLQNTESSKENQGIFDDDLVATNNHDFQFTIERNENSMPPTLNKNTPNDCNSEETLMQVAKMKQKLNKNTPNDCNSEETLMQVVSDSLSSNEDLSLSNNEYQKSVISFDDLQDMSNSILNLSESQRLLQNKSNTNGNSNAMDDFQTSNPKVFIHFGENSENINRQDTSILKKKSDERNGNEDEGGSFCESTKPFDKSDLTDAETKTLFKNLNKVNSDILAKGSRHDSNVLKTTNLKARGSLVPSLLDNIKNRNVAPNLEKFTAKNTDVLQVSKNSDILDNIKSRLGRIFSTTEATTKTKTHDMLVPEDSVNESSNINPVLSRFDEFNNLQHAPQLFKNVLSSQNSGLNLNPLNFDLGLFNIPSDVTTLNKVGMFQGLEFPRPQKLRNPLENIVNLDNVGSTLKNNLQNIMSSPLDMSRPFEDTFDFNIPFNDISNRFRSHTENALQSVRDTLESRLQETQSVFNIPNNILNTQDILESMSNTRNELNEKLQSIHSDFNDKFSSFHQSVLDQVNLPSVRHSYFEEDDSAGFRNTPLGKQSQLPQISISRKMKQEENVESLYPHRLILSKDENNSERKVPKASKVYDTSRISNSDKLLQDLQGNIKNIGINSKKNALRLNNSDRKSSLQLPVTTVKQTLTPRQQTLKIQNDSESRDFGLNKNKFSNSRQSGLPILKEEKDSRSTSLLTKSGRTGTHSVEPLGSSRYTPGRTNNPLDVLKAKDIREELPTDSPVNKLRKSLLQRSHNIKPSTDFTKKTSIHWSSPLLSHDEDATEQGTFLSRMREGKLRLGSYKSDTKNNDDLVNSPSSSVTNTAHSAARNTDVRLVEPLKENVPYKCKLICYKDT